MEQGAGALAEVGGPSFALLEALGLPVVSEDEMLRLSSRMDRHFTTERQTKANK